MPGIPICVYKPDMRMFLVTMYRGKIFFSGGFGVTRPCAVVAHDASNTRALRPTKDRDDEETSDDETKTNEQARRDVDSKNKNGEDCEDDAVQEASPNGADETTVELTTTNGSDSVGDGGREDGEGVRENVYLFLEEALYLHERGLLQVLDETGDEPMNSPRLFSMLEVHGIDLASYLTYAHLRTQTFVVLRHRDPKVVVDEKDDDETKERPDADALAEKQRAARQQQRRDRRLRLRSSAFYAPPPRALRPCDDDDLSPTSPPLAFDVYAPNRDFRRSDPGPPDHRVLIAWHGAPSSVGTIRRAMEASAPVPLRIATVSDSGTVIMFSVTNGDVPVIA